MTAIIKKSVLICDDEPNIRESIRYAVEKAGYSHSMVSDGIAAYESAYELKPDLIILDVGMPGLTGYEVCKKLRDSGEFENTKILILTAHNQADDKNMALDAGANFFMSKPFSPRNLRVKIEELLA